MDHGDPAPPSDRSRPDPAEGTVRPVPELPPGRHVETDTGRQWVWEEPGPPGAPILVLVHGWTSTAALNWCWCFAPLAHRWRVVAPDVRGHGRGPRSDRAFRLEDCADDVAALIDRLDTGPVILVGYSMGGPIALLTARRHPSRVGGLVACATAARFGGQPALGPVVDAVGRGLGLAWTSAPASWRQAAVDRLLADRAGHPLGQQATEEWRVNDARAMIGSAAALNRFDARVWAGGLEVAAASVIPRRDRTVDPERQRELARALRARAVEEVDGDHRVCIDHPFRFVRALDVAASAVLPTAG